MIKWRGRGAGGRELIGFGLEENNLGRLRKGDPILVRGDVMGLPFDVLIYYGKDMEALLKVSMPGIGPETVIHDDRQRKKQ